jgi:hypothetical protein
MIQVERRLPALLALSLLSLSLTAGCFSGFGSNSPWPSGKSGVAFEHADVSTLNEGYQRTKSGVLVRQIRKPTRAALDFAAYHGNFMNADPPPEDAPPKGKPDPSNPFDGNVDKTTLTSDIARTPLTENERAHPLAFPPAVEWLASKKVTGAEGLGDVAAAVRSESWGLPGGPQFVRQMATELLLHAADGGTTELWVKIEFQPWFEGFGKLPDQDGDGFPEIYGRLKSELATPAVVEALRSDYASRELSPAEVKGWANKLSSYWYPSYNTDLVPPGAAWPDDQTEADIKKELGSFTVPSPTFVMRGKPQGKATYNVFVVRADASAGSKAGDVTAAGGAKPAASAPALKLARTKPTPQPAPVAATVKQELKAQGGGSWTKWASKVAPFHDGIRKKLRAAPKVKGFAGNDGFLFFRNSMEYVAGGDLEKQPKGKNPLPIIVEFKKTLDAHGVDFLFVPVPNKEEIFPDQLDPKQKALAGKVVNPFGRKFLQSLSQAGVEVVDLLPTFLAARVEHDDPKAEPLYQRQDTHWTDRGLRLGAEIVSARIKKYPWYKEVSAHSRTYSIKETSFTRFGDLHSRLPDALKKKYKPETLIAHQVLGADGTVYDDDPDSPIVVLGDSFTGVYELTDAEHAGVSAHIAKAISYPVDLVMSYGGGPNVRQKLMRRGADALNSKKLVIWMMTARDMYNYWEDWEPLKAK